MDRYNPLAEGHVERVGVTKFGTRPVYIVVEPEHHAIRACLEGYKYVPGKYVLDTDRAVTGWVYRPAPNDYYPALVEEKCEKCGLAGSELEIFDQDSEVYGVACPCGHLWLSSLHPER